MKTIGITANLENPRTPGMLVRLGAAVSSQGLRLAAWGDTAILLERLGVPFIAGSIAETEALMVLGGDGTMLRAVRDTVASGRPVIGVNIGSLGFLTSVAENDLERAVESLARDAFTTSSRTMAVCAVHRGDRVLAESLCLNEIVVRNGETGRMVALDIAVDGGAAAPISADGLIVATPTGSTGHSLSAGGPILHPACPAFVVTFICAHALGARPLVIPDTSLIEVGAAGCAGEVRLQIDGQANLALEPGDRVRVFLAPNTVRFIHLPGHEFLSLLHQKLHWQGSSLNQSRAG